ENEKTWLQRFLPRRPKSLWSKINREKVIALIEGGRMHAAGLAEIERAKRDGRWGAAYDLLSRGTVPPDFQRQLDRNPKAKGFYGLVAAGWELSDFGTPWPRGRLPKDANLSEIIVGFFDRERASGERWAAAGLNDQLANFAAENGLPLPDPISEDELAKIRRR